MSSLEDKFEITVAAAVLDCARLAADSTHSGRLNSVGLMAALAGVSEARRSLDAAVAALAGEAARRSAREVGLAGLAQSQGFRTPEALVQSVTGSNARDAITLVRVGTMITDAVTPQAPAGSTSGVPVRPWLVSVGSAVAAGTLSVAAAEAIRAGLGEPAVGVDVAALAGAAEALLTIAPGLNADEVLRRGRSARDELDAAGIAVREHARREQRQFRRWRKPDGMTRYSWELDPEGAALVDDIYDQLTSPRRGGPRFVDPAEKERAATIEHDPRTTEQIASDGLLELLRIAVGTDPRQIVGVARPAVRVLVSADHLRDRAGHGRIEGHHDPISIETVERLACADGIVPISFDAAGQAIDVGREQRLFTRRQRIALAARDGGCRWPGCERPPGWTEAHHIEHWKRDNGATNLSNGILLCRHHHLLLHDNHWEIELDNAGGYHLIPPPEIDQAQEARPMPSKSAALADLQRLNVTTAAPATATATA